MGRVTEARPTPAGIRLTIDPAGWDHRPEPGESVAVGGCCLTVAGTGGTLSFDVVAETLSKTVLGTLTAGSPVNLERSVRASDLMSGHVVQGHVDGVGTVERVQRAADWRVWIRPPAPLMEYIVPKGSVCVDGVSLTIAGLGSGVFEVALIPVTLEKTTLRTLDAGSRVNLEADVIAKTVVHWLRQREGGT